MHIHTDRVRSTAHPATHGAQGHWLWANNTQTKIAYNKLSLLLVFTLKGSVKSTQSNIETHTHIPSRPHPLRKVNKLAFPYSLYSEFPRPIELPIKHVQDGARPCVPVSYYADPSVWVQRSWPGLAGATGEQMRTVGARFNLAKRYRTCYAGVPRKDGMNFSHSASNSSLQRGGKSRKNE